MRISRRHSRPEIAAELELALECCRWSFEAGNEDRIRSLVSKVDWALFLRTLQFHRVEGLASACLVPLATHIPSGVTKILELRAKQIAAANLRRLVEASALRHSFKEAGIPMLFVKGLTLGALAYSNALLKDGWDIDLLVAEQDIGAASAELEKRGYSMTFPATSDLRAWHSTHKESVWSKPGERLFVELHTRLSDNPKLIEGIGIHSPIRDVEVLPGYMLPTLEEDELAAYLFVHGASSLWFRLKWITDLAALLHRLAPEDIQRLYYRSMQLGSGRAAAQGLLHADDLYGSLVGTGLRRELEVDRAARWLADLALRQVAGNDNLTEPTGKRLGTLPIHIAQLFLLPGIRFKAVELVRQAKDALA